MVAKNFLKMTEYRSEEAAPQVVDLDTCPKKKSIVIGAAVTLLLGFVPYSYVFLMCHYFFGGMAAAGHFARRHRVSISAFQGVKLGVMSSMIGMLVFFVAVPLWLLPSVTDEQWAEVSEQLVKDAYESGQPEAADIAQDFLKSENVPTMLIGMFVVLLISALCLGSLGGLVGSAAFKSGPPAR